MTKETIKSVFMGYSHHINDDIFDIYITWENAPDNFKARENVVSLSFPEDFNTSVVYLLQKEFKALLQYMRDNNIKKVGEIIVSHRSAHGFLNTEGYTLDDIENLTSYDLKEFEEAWTQ